MPNRSDRSRASARGRCSDDPTDEELADLAERLGRALERVAVRVATAESCTGGWIAKALTDVPGSSHWFEGGVVAYSNSAKSRCSACRAAARGARRRVRGRRARDGRGRARAVRRAARGRRQRRRGSGRRHTGQARRHGLVRVGERPRRRRPAAASSPATARRAPPDRRARARRLSSWPKRDERRAAGRRRDESATIAARPPARVLRALARCRDARRGSHARRGTRCGAPAAGRSRRIACTSRWRSSASSRRRVSRSRTRVPPIPVGAFDARSRHGRRVRRVANALAWRAVGAARARRARAPALEALAERRVSRARSGSIGRT